MFQHGILVLTYRPKNFTTLLSKVGSYLSVASKNVSKTLYVSLQPNQNGCSGTTNFNNDNNEIDINQQLFDRKDFIKMVPAIYVEAHKQVPFLDVRVLHHWQYRNPINNLKIDLSTIKRKLAFPPQVIITNEKLNNDLLQKHLKNFDIAEQLEIISMDKEDGDFPENNSNQFVSSMISEKVYDYVCLGGTFDNLHNGHKILLSIGQLKCEKILTIGVTNEDMVKNKTLGDLIESPQKRVESLNNYLRDVDPFIEYNSCIISDPFGPAIIDKSLQAIIVSEETVKGGQKINEIRRSKGFPELDIEVIKLLEDQHKTSNVEENKVSSSSLRIRKLGTLLKEPEDKPHLPKHPYLIGLTGIIASGKSSIAKKLATLGAGIINVDLLAHKTYQDSNAPAYKKLIETFGTKILDQNGNINRMELGKIVFDDESKLKTLNQIIWPEVFKLMEKEVDQMKHQYKVIILEIALLIESQSWDRVHQVWLTILDEKEVVRRLKHRNNLSEEDAKKRIEAMMPQKDKLKYANVVFCTQWEESFTMEQCKKAWKMLNEKFL